MAFTVPTYFTAYDRMTAPMRRMSEVADRFSRSVEASKNKMVALNHSAKQLYNSFNPLKGVMGAFASLGIGIGVVGTLQKVVNEAAKMEQHVSAFSTILGGSLPAGQKMVSMLQEMAKQTPFGFEALAKNANLLMSFNAASQDDVIEKMRILGDLTQGNAEKFSAASLAYGQIAAAGKASMQDVNQLINAQIPILAALEKQWGIPIASVREQISKGKLTIGELDKAFTTLTSKGGMFFQAMATQSNTFSGKMAAFQDSIDNLAAKVGARLLPILNTWLGQLDSLAESASNWVEANQELISQQLQEWADRISNAVKWLAENYETVINAVKWFGGTLLALKAIILVTNGYIAAATLATKLYTGAQKIAAFSQKAFNAIVAWGNLAITAVGNSLLWAKVKIGVYSAASKIATAAQWAWNAAMTANPIGIIILLIAALVGAIIWLATSVEGWGEQWDEVWEWAKANFYFFVAAIKLNLQFIAHAFWTMVDKVVSTWYWMQNKLGLMSDERYNSEMAKIQEEKNARIKAMQETSQEMMKHHKRVTEGVEWKLKWKEDGSADTDQIISAINPKMTEQQILTNVQKVTETNEIKLKIESENAAVGVQQNTGNIPIQLSPSVKRLFGNV